ncbi:MAG: toll/interleukin-1 receptor domain-containing protein [Candidatus Thiodiazotropha endolucinida]
MSDIFISYKREEQDKAKLLASALAKQGWSVWWDPKLRGGQRFDDVIQQSLTDARCVIALLSPHALQSSYVMNEARYALRRRKLVPVVIDTVELPFDLEGVHTPQLFDWDGDESSADYIKLLDDITVILRKSPAQEGKASEGNRHLIVADTDSASQQETEPDMESGPAKLPDLNQYWTRLLSAPDQETLESLVDELRVISHNHPNNLELGKLQKKLKQAIAQQRVAKDQISIQRYSTHSRWYRSLAVGVAAIMIIAIVPMILQMPEFTSKYKDNSQIIISSENTNKISSEEIAIEALRRAKHVSALANSAQNNLRSTKLNGRPFMEYRDDLRQLTTMLELLWRTTASYGIFADPYPHPIKVTGSSGPGPKLPEESKFPLKGLPQLRKDYLKLNRINQLSDKNLTLILAKYEDIGTFPLMEFTFLVYESGTVSGQPNPPDFTPYLEDVDNWLDSFKRDVDYIVKYFIEPS